MLAADPKNRFALDLEGRALRDLRGFDEAAAAADALLAQDPQRPEGRLPEGHDRRGAARLRRRPRPCSRRSWPGRRRADEEGASNDRVFLVHLGFAYQQLGRFADAAEAFGRATRRGGRRPTPTSSATTPRRSTSPRTTTRPSPRSSGPRALPRRPDLAGLEATILREKGDTPGPWPSSRPCAQKSPDRPEGARPQVAEFYQRAKRFPRPRARCARRSRSTRRTSRRCSSSGRCSSARSGTTSRGRLPRGARVEPDSAPVLNYLGYMNADRGVRVEEALALHREGGGARPENGAYLDSLGWALFRLDRLEAGRAGRAHGRSRSTAKNAVVLDHLGDILASGAASPRPSTLAEGAEGRGRGRRARPRPRRGEDPRGPGGPRGPAAARRAAHALSSRVARAPARRRLRDGRACRRRASPSRRGRRGLVVAAACACRSAGPDLRGRSRALVAFRRPDALRIEVPGPTGARLVAVARAGRLTAVLPGRAGRLRGRGHGRATWRRCSASRSSPRELMDLLRGRRPRGGCATTRRAGATTLPRRVEARPRRTGRASRRRWTTPRPDPTLPAAAFDAAAARRLPRGRRRRGAPAAGEPLMPRALRLRVLRQGQPGPRGPGPARRRLPRAAHPVPDHRPPRRHRCCARAPRGVAVALRPPARAQGRDEPRRAGRAELLRGFAGRRARGRDRDPRSGSRSAAASGAGAATRPRSSWASTGSGGWAWGRPASTPWPAAWGPTCPSSCSGGPPWGSPGGTRSIPCAARSGPTWSWWIPGVPVSTAAVFRRLDASLTPRENSNSIFRFVSRDLEGSGASRS